MSETRARLTLVPAPELAQPALPGPADEALARLDAWLETLRGPGGYGGPVAHWRRHSLLYTGAGLDWRYEGIIAGYLALWERAGQQRWLEKACRAGDDLVAGQLPSGHFAASAFEHNPASAAPLHEAACDLALLVLAQTLRLHGMPGWERYADCAERNLRAFFLGALWDPKEHLLRADPRRPLFAPSAAATASEALLTLAELRGDESLAMRVALPTLRRVLTHQRRGGQLDGAIPTSVVGRRAAQSYLPLEAARCVPALLLGFRWGSDEALLDGAVRAMRFVLRWRDEDGALPAAVYARGGAARQPRLVAALGDALRAADLLRPYGFDADMSATERWVLDGQDATGGIRTARGLAAQAAGALPEAIDVLRVAGWCDKAFRYLAGRASSVIPEAVSDAEVVDCTLAGRAVQLVETPEVLGVYDKESVRYRWRKGAPWAEAAESELWLG